jgi:hypothetical protein
MMQRTPTLWIWTDISRSLNPEKPIPLSFDLANLTAFDTNPLSQSSLLDEHSVQSIARDATQLLVNQLLSLPRTRSLEGAYIQLPAPTTPLPREKSVQPNPRSILTLVTQTQTSNEMGVVRQEEGYFQNQDTEYGL